jgi:hypothetical protein
MDRAKDAKKDFLGQIEGLIVVAQEVDGELDHHPLVLRHQFGAGQLVARCTPLHQRRFASADVRPTGDPRLLQ